MRNALNKTRNVYSVSTISSIVQSKDIEEGSTSIENAEFETAISETKFGKFNIWLYLISIPAGWTNVFETTTMSYVVPSAQCDLNLSLTDKGFLNAITFLGMITSAFIWGYLCDTLGRKKLLVIGYFLDGIFVFISGFYPSFTFLLVFKYLGGLIINGPFAAHTAYLSEFHSKKFRAKVQMGRGIILALGNIVLPLLAFGILSQDIRFVMIGNIELHSWNIYLLICSLPSFLSAITFAFMPESPKFLMTMGRNDEALKIFQKVYSLNTGKNKESYRVNTLSNFEIKSLIDEVKLNEESNTGGHITLNRTKTQALKEGLQQIKPVCFPPYLKYTVLVCMCQVMIMMSVNSLRLWLPQIFQAFSDYAYLHNGTTSDFCDMISLLRPGNATNDSCFVNYSPSVYSNTMIIAAASISGYLVALSIIDVIGQKRLLNSGTLIAGVCALCIMYSQNIATVLALSSVFIALGGLCSNIVISVVIDAFPTWLRTFTISLVMMLGRTSSMAGNMIIPFLISWGCSPPFIFVGSVMIGVSVLSLLLPKTDSSGLR